MHLGREAVGDAEEHVGEEDADEGGSGELDAEVHHRLEEADHLLPEGEVEREEGRVNEAVGGDELVGVGDAFEEDEGAVEGEEEGNEDVVVEEADGAGLCLSGGVGDLEGR